VSAYCSQNDLNGLISAQNLINLTDDNGTGSVDAGVLAAIIAVSSNTVDGMLCATYQVPFSPVPALVQQSAIIFTCEALFGRRLVPGEQNPFTSRANMFRKQLEKIAQDRGGLDAQTSSAFSPGFVGIECSRVNSTTM
jgi:phage gp36-like protein